MRSLRVFFENAFVAAAYIAGAQVGFKLAFLHSQVSPVWPPEGIALAAVMVLRFRVVPGVLAGAFLANYLNNPNLPTAALIATGNTLSVVTSYVLISRFTTDGHPFGHPRDVLKFLTIGTMPGATISALLGVGSLYYFGFLPAGAFLNVLVTWWTGEMQGLIIVAPFLYSLSRKLEISSTYGSRKRGPVFEGILLLALTVGSAMIAFRTAWPVSYLPIPFILWSVFRFRLHGGATALLIVSFVAIIHTIHHIGPFAVVAQDQVSLNDSLLLLELYIGFLAIVTHLVTSIVTERAQALSLQHKSTIELAEQSMAFYRFVPDAFLRILGKSSALEIMLGDTREMEMSVLFSDVRSYTSISESLTPRESIQLINTYLARMEPVIQRHGGFVDKFIGDAIMALFPEEPDRPSAERAVACAVEMRQQLREFNSARASQNLPPLECGIGVATGSVVLGTVGSEMRLDTTVIGDTVNLASRLESLTARFNLSILIAAATMKAINRPLRARPLGVLTLKGKKQPTDIYEVFEADEESAAAAKAAAGELIVQALPLYIGRLFDQALMLFERAYGISREPLLEQYIERCRTYIQVPPPDAWNGSEVLRDK